MVHNTSAVGPIIESKFLLQQGGKGGINQVSKNKEACYRPGATHAAVIDTELSVKMGIFFFGNCFSDVFAAQVDGKMEIGMVRSH